MLTVLVASDGSDHALRALEQLLSMMDSKTLHVHLLNVQEGVHMSEVPLRGTLADVQAVEKEREAPGLKALASAAALLEQAGVSHAVHVKVGAAAQTIVAFATEYHCEMIVMGSRGMGSVANLVLGSVANKVVHLTNLPVLLVK